MTQFGPGLGEVTFRGKSLRVEALPLGVKRIVLSRPAVRNAFDETMVQELRTALDELASIPAAEEMRLLVLTGEGRAFSAGADIEYMKRLSRRGYPESLEDARVLAGAFFRLADFPTPVLCAVQGAAIGGGLGITVCADHVLAEDQALFATTEVRLGIVPAVISPYIVRKIGIARASSLMLSGRRVKANEAAALGIVQSLCTPSELGAAIEKLIVEFLSAGPEAGRRTKDLIKKAYPLPGPELIELTADSIARARCSDEAHHGFEAFLNKTLPPWAIPESEL